jgi:hypothetical protein
MYPNPAVNYFALKRTSKVEVYSMLGHMVKALIRLVTLSRFDISDLSSGMYIIKAYNDQVKFK